MKVRLKNPRNHLTSTFNWKVLNQKSAVVASIYGDPAQIVRAALFLHRKTRLRLLRLTWTF